MIEEILLSGHSLNLTQIVQVARQKLPVALTPAAQDQVRVARAIVEQLAHSRVPIYGVTTALGAKVKVALDPSDLTAFQVRSLLGRSVAVGAEFATDIVRAIMLVRVNGLAIGGAGVSLEVLNALIALLNAGIHPIVPAIGSIGAADLAPLAHLALPLIGQGVVEFRGNRLASHEALAQANLAPIQLGVKEGLILCSTNAAALGHGAIVLSEVFLLWETAAIAAALSIEGFRANLSPLDPRVQAAHPALGQTTTAARLRTLLAGSDLWQPETARRLQDPLSFRCITQVYGACLATLEQARDTLEFEVNSTADNPLVLPDGVILSNGNFHLPAIALQFETLGLSLAMLANLTVERVKRLMSPTFTNLPLNLTPLGGDRTGFAALQKTLTALEANLRHLAAPICLNTAPVSEAVEDHATLAPLVIDKLDRMLTPLRYILAIELLVAAQAIDLHESLRLGQGVEVAYQAVRSIVTFLEDDRILSTDVERLYTLIAEGAIVQRVNTVGLDSFADGI